MKSKNKSILRTAFAVFLSIFIFSAFVYGYLYINMENAKSKADTKDYSVPYESPAPENTGVLVCFEGLGSTIIYLDFEADSIYLLDVTEDTVDTADYGFPADYTVKADFNSLKTAVDIVGGIDLEVDGEELRYTGVQVAELLSDKVDTDYLERQIILSFFKQISKNGILREDLINIFESTQTELSVPEFYRWADYLGSMSRRVSFVN